MRRGSGCGRSTGSTAQPLAGTEGASYPFWAPDGRAIGFFAGGKLKRIDLAGGRHRCWRTRPRERGGTWNRDGVIVFAPTAFGPLMRVAATGGTPVAVTRLAAGQGSHRWPQFLPDGRRFLFFMGFGRLGHAGRIRGVARWRRADARAGGGDGGRVCSAGRSLVVRQGVLVALRFDQTRGVVSGEPIPVAQAVGSDAGVARGTFSVSATGVLAHRAGGAERRQLVWVDRAGTVLGTVGPPDENALGQSRAGARWPARGGAARRARECRRVADRGRPRRAEPVHVRRELRRLSPCGHRTGAAWCFGPLASGRHGPVREAGEWRRRRAASAGDG